MHHHFYHFGGHHGSHRFGRFGRGFMGGGMGGRGFGMGRKLASGDLQLLILKLLDERPRYGYEIIKELDERSKGFYVPSPGMVYPALTYLEEIGHATVAADGARKLYSITALGKTQLAENLAAADALFAQFGRVGEKMDRVRRALDAEDHGEEPAEHEGRGSRELHRARHELKAALADKWHSSREEQQRIAAILASAAAEIAGK
ncbi:MAG TPA: PadR family transcriptional regulator [Steroidobacteraceae bacterium]|jgi:DNA-binding PadR family transcriptional regulator|nr:PadR family transcriptional regulator [Steroidobacteraceae bacterium]